MPLHPPSPGVTTLALNLPAPASLEIVVGTLIFLLAGTGGTFSKSTVSVLLWIFPEAGSLGLKKNLNAPRPSEHPPVRGKKCQNV